MEALQVCSNPLGDQAELQRQELKVAFEFVTVFGLSAALGFSGC